jgi:hypothetical protein
MRTLILIALTAFGLNAGTINFSMDTSTLGNLFAPGQTVTAVFQITSFTPGTTAVEISSFLPGGTPAGVNLNDNDFYNEATIEFTMGSMLSFAATFTSLLIDPDPTPDGFAFALLDADGNYLSTTDPNGILLFALNIDDLVNPTLDVHGAVDGQFNIVNPNVVFTPAPASGVPEPSTYAAGIAALGLLGMIQWKGHVKKQSRRAGGLQGSTGASGI